MVARVLIADDDMVVRDIVRRYLERDGLLVDVAGDGSEALRLLGSRRIDVAVLDVMMPGPSGLSLCRSLREANGFNMPVILLTALSEEDDRIAGLEAGADDYVTKPFSPRELVLRVHSVLRRASSPVAAQALEIRVGELTVHTATRTVSAGDRPIGLTSREFDLLLFFLAHTGAVFSREELLTQVWQWEFGDLSTVTQHVKRLRHKLGDHHRVDTVWGRGYRWSDRVDA